jgi:hypothetical protein
MVGVLLVTLMQSTVQVDVEKSNRQNRKQTVKWIKRGFQEVYKAPGTLC